jgi:hypothetical protein
MGNKAVTGKGAEVEKERLSWSKTWRVCADNWTCIDVDWISEFPFQQQKNLLEVVTVYYNVADTNVSSCLYQVQE